MSCSFQSSIIERAKLTLACRVLSVFAVLFAQSGIAEPLIPPVPQATDWISGPSSNSLSTIASIRIPQGYKFADEQGARAFLERMTNSVPKGLVGILCPESEGWWVVLAFTETGHINDDLSKPLDSDAILTSLQAQVERKNVARVKQGLPAISIVDWELKPLYDANERTLEWAVRVQSQPQPVVNHTVCLLGRRGVLEATLVRPYKGFSDLTPLKQLLQGISFADGETYADHRSGDKLSAAGLAAMITADNSAREAIDLSATLAVKAGSQPEDPWLLIGLSLFAGVALLVGVVLLVRKYRRLTPPREKEQAGAAATTPAPTPLGRNGPSQVVVALPAEPSRLRPTAKTEMSRKGVNGKQQAARRRKMFDYNRYFSDLNSAVSGHLAQVELGGVNGSTAEVDRLPRTPSAGEATPAGHLPMANEHSDFIASQKALIEEQKRLIHEQSRLIEEKTKLIAEKNQLLKLQSEMIENELL